MITYQDEEINDVDFNVNDVDGNINDYDDCDADACLEDNEDEYILRFR